MNKSLQKFAHVQHKNHLQWSFLTSAHFRKPLAPAWSLRPFLVLIFDLHLSISIYRLPGDRDSSELVYCFNVMLCYVVLILCPSASSCVKSSVNGHWANNEIIFAPRSSKTVAFGAAVSLTSENVSGGSCSGVLEKVSESESERD